MHLTKRKVIVFHLLNNFTGSPQVLRAVIESLNKEEYEIELYTSRTSGFLSDIKGVKYHSNFYFRSRYRIITLFTFFFSQFFLFTKLLFSKRLNGNTIYYINTVLPFSAVLIGKLKGYKIISHVHEFRLSPNILNSFLFFVVNRFSDHIIIVSNYLKLNHLRTKAKVHVVYNTVKNEFIDSIRHKKRSGIPFTVLMLASLRPYKGIMEFVNLARRMDDIKFDLVLSESQSSIDHYFKSVNASSNINIYPIQQDVISFYENADLVVNLSDSSVCIETFGLTILEAMFFGLPVIVPTVGGISELVDHGENGFKVDSKNEEEIVRIINVLRADPDYWSKLSRCSSQKSKAFLPLIFRKNMNDIIGGVFSNNLK